MRYISMIFMMLLLSGCVPSKAVFYEHDAEAAMQAAMRLYVSVVEENAEVTTVLCVYPQETDMAQTLADRFALENRRILTDDAAITVTVEDGTATLDLQGLPGLENAAEEQALLTALKNTMTQLSGVETVRFLFDGEALAELPHGTRCFGEFGMD